MFCWWWIKNGIKRGRFLKKNVKKVHLKNQRKKEFVF